MVTMAILLILLLARTLAALSRIRGVPLDRPWE
jgi:hypothetical protein